MGEGRESGKQSCIAKEGAMLQATTVSGVADIGLVSTEWLQDRYDSNWIRYCLKYKYRHSLTNLAWIHRHL